MELYHTTFGKYKNDILNDGLIPCPENSNWIWEDYIGIFNQHPIFLTTNPALGVNEFLRKSKASKEIKDTGFIIFKIKNYDKSKLRVDPIWHDNFEEEGIEGLWDIDYVDCLAYLSKNIPPSQLEIYEEGEL